MKKSLFLLPIFLLEPLVSFEPPKERKPNPEKTAPVQSLTQQARPPIKKVEQSPFFDAIYNIGSQYRIQSLMDQGVTITPAELYHLINVQQGEKAGYHLHFWLHFGSDFLMYGTVRALTPQAGRELRSLKDLAAEAIFKDVSVERRQRSLANPVFRDIAVSCNFPLIQQEIKNIFEKVIKAEEGPISTQKVKIRQEMRNRAEEQLTHLWLEIVNTQPSGFSVTVLEYIVQLLWENPTLVHSAQILLKKYIAIWVENRCTQLLKITRYMRAKGVLQIIANEVLRSYQNLLHGFEEFNGPVTREQMYVYEDFKNLLEATPGTCPAVVQITLLKRLGSKARDILEGKVR